MRTVYIFLRPDNGVAPDVYDFVTCGHNMLTRATAHGGCTDTVRESALKDDPGKERKKEKKKKKKKIAALGTRTRVSTATGFSVRRSTH